DRITGLIQSAEKGLTLVVLGAGIVAFAVAAFLWFRKRRMHILDENPDSLLENRELIFGPAADRLSDSSVSAAPHQTEHVNEERFSSETKHESHSKEAKTTSSTTDD
ncbi:MAG TPA: hypothetical protein DDZ24_09130, partial [Planctomycetaceae bacterium]|nr:hypothetical protein [Planctomycetaceae bacterium]